MSIPSRFVCALVMILVGYHVSAWSLPPQMIPLRVPVERWFMVVVGGALAVVATLLIDRMQRDGVEQDPAAK